MLNVSTILTLHIRLILVNRWGGSFLGKVSLDKIGNVLYVVVEQINLLASVDIQ